MRTRCVFSTNVLATVVRLRRLRTISTKDTQSTLDPTKMTAIRHRAGTAFIRQKLYRMEER